MHASNKQNKTTDSTYFTAGGHAGEEEKKGCWVALELSETTCLKWNNNFKLAI
jgi:hypothetical protein